MGDDGTAGQRRRRHRILSATNAGEHLEVVCHVMPAGTSLLPEARSHPEGRYSPGPSGPIRALMGPDGLAAWCCGQGWAGALDQRGPREAPEPQAKCGGPRLTCHYP
ncbi:unnamed protein product [Gadus morhua 'NCC']